MNLVELLDRATQSGPETPAIIDGRAGREQVLSYAGLEDRSRRLASLFAAAGLRAGEGIVVMVPMSAELYAVIAAAWRLGLVPVLMDPGAGDPYFRHCLSRYPVRAFVGTPAACLLRLASPALRQIPAVFVAGAFFPGARALRSARALPPHAQNYGCSAGTPAMLAFTSGSTGRPKGIVRTHGLLRATHEVLSRHLGTGVAEVAVATMPVFTLTHLASGSTSLIPDVDLRHPGAVDPARLVGQVERWHAASVVASPALLERVADHCQARGKGILSLRAVFAGGAPVFPALLDKLAVAAPRASLRVLYGSTEAEPIALVAASELDGEDIGQTLAGRGLLVGRPIPEIELRILRDRWGSVRAEQTVEALDRDTLPAGQAGEIVLAGPHVAQGYLGGEGDAESKVRVGSQVWHRTGDAGWLDARGRLWLLGRCAARIEDRNGVLYPFAVEAVLSNHSSIVRSAVLARRGERLLVLEMRGKAQPDPAMLLETLGWAHIRAVVQVERVPVDARHNAKVDYPALRQLLDSGRWLRRIDVVA